MHIHLTYLHDIDQISHLLALAFAFPSSHDVFWFMTQVFCFSAHFLKEKMKYWMIITNKCGQRFSPGLGRFHWNDFRFDVGLRKKNQYASLSNPTMLFANILASTPYSAKTKNVWREATVGMCSEISAGNFTYKLCALEPLLSPFLSGPSVCTSTFSSVTAPIDIYTFFRPNIDNQHVFER